jgi:hypothetical protein
MFPTVAPRLQFLPTTCAQAPFGRALWAAGMVMLTLLVGFVMPLRWRAPRPGDAITQCRCHGRAALRCEVLQGGPLKL